MSVKFLGVLILFLTVTACTSTPTQTVDTSSVKKGRVPAQEAVHPLTKVGECLNTTISSIDHRIPGDDSTGPAVEFANKLYQVDYNPQPNVTSSVVGDPVKICLVSIPQDCPPGDSRGYEYTTTNLRTNLSWTMYDDQHLCGGA